jgi:hypothetical protein
MTGTPVWRRTVDTVDNRVSERLAHVVRNDNFAIAVGVLLRGRREVQNRVGSATTAVLHAFNLPAKRDLDRLLRHVATLEREVLALSDRPAPPAATPTRTPTPPRTRRTNAAKDGTA